MERRSGNEGKKLAETVDSGPTDRQFICLVPEDVIAADPNLQKLRKKRPLEDRREINRLPPSTPLAY